MIEPGRLSIRLDRTQDDGMFISLLTCGAILALALVYRAVSSHKASRSESRAHEEKSRFGRALHRRDLGNFNLAIACTAVLSMGLWYTSRVEQPKQPNINLAGDVILSTRTLNSLERLRKDWQIPGVAIALVKMEQDATWKQQTVGLGKMNTEGHPVTDTTLFGIASNSKLFTSIVAGLALSRANLTWETPVHAVMPSFRLMDPDAQRETSFIELLSHQTGVPRHDLSYDANATAQQMIKLFANLRASAPVKTRWQYNNIAYSAASYLPEQLFGENFEDFVRDNIWRPLGMTDSFYDIQAARATNRLASGFARRLSPGVSKVRDIRACLTDVQEHHGVLSDRCRGKEQALGWYARYWRGNAGAGGVITCSKDLIIWLQTLLLEGRHPETNQSVIPALILQDVRRPRIASRSTSDEPEMTVPQYGMGQSTYSYRGHEIVEHGGDLPGQESQVVRVPSKMIGLAVMVNDEQMGALFHEVAKWTILDELLGLEPIDWRERKLTRFLAQVQTKEVAGRSDQSTGSREGFRPLVGIYHNEAYGNLSIELAGTLLKRPESSRNDALGISPVLRARIDKVWADELWFDHFGENAFNVTSKLVLPDTAAVLWDINGSGIQARFGEGGVGFQGIWGAGEGVENGDMDKFGIRNGAEVFFERKG